MNTEKYYYPEGCRKISGSDDACEYAFRKMVIACVTWLSDHNCEKKVYSMYCEVSTDDETIMNLREVMIDAAGYHYGTTMYVHCIMHASYAHANGWEDYIKQIKGEEK